MSHQLRRNKSRLGPFNQMENVRIHAMKGIRKQAEKEGNWSHDDVRMSDGYLRSLIFGTGNLVDFETKLRPHVVRVVQNKFVATVWLQRNNLDPQLDLPGKRESWYQEKLDEWQRDRATPNPTV